MNQKVNIIIERDHAGYYAYCPQLVGCQSQGDTFEEVLVNIKEALELYLETLSRRMLYLLKSRNLHDDSRGVTWLNSSRPANPF